MSSKGTMTPIHTNPSRRSSPKAAPPAAPSRPKPAPNTPTVPASSSSYASHGLVERPYAPVLPPSTTSHERETVEALVGLASANQLSPTTANLTSSFSAINVAIPHGLPNSSQPTSSQYDYSSNIPSPGIHSDEYLSDTAEDTRNTDASSTRPRRRRRSNSVGVESPRDHRKPYDGHVLKEDTVMGDAPSPWNYPQAPQQDPRHVPHPLLPKSMALSGRVNKSKHHPHSQRPQLPPPHYLLLPRAQPALVTRSQQPIARHSKQTNKPQILKTESPRMYATDVDGYKVLRGAVSVELAKAAADILDHGMEAVEKGDTHKSFGLSLQAYRVRDEFTQNVSARLYYHPSLGLSWRFLHSGSNFQVFKPTCLWSFLCPMDQILLLHLRSTYLDWFCSLKIV